MQVALIDYGAGNPQSVHQALERVGAHVVRVTRPQEVAGADAMVLPGQGHFGQVMQAFRARGFESAVVEHLQSGKPFLGICVGLQLLLDASDEAPGVHGLGLIPGCVVRFPDAHVSVPHMGWNTLACFGDSPLLRGIGVGAHAYFAHSFVVVDVHEQDADGGAWTQHGDTRFVSAFSRGNLHATQFHPEKSQRVGLQLLRNFVEHVHQGSHQFRVGVA